MATLQVGLLGCGRIVQLFHLKELLAMHARGSVRLAAIAEPDDGRRAAALQACPTGTRGFASYPTLLAERDIDAVVICLPAGMHAVAAIEAFDLGKHVYLEKPAAIDLDEGVALLQAWRRSAKTGMIGFNFRFNSLYQEAKVKLAIGTLGPLVAARSVQTSAARVLQPWKRDRAQGGGVLLDLASHHFDLARYLFDTEIRAVGASLRSIRADGDSAVIEAELSNGVSMQSFFSWSTIEEHSFEVYGVKGRLRLDRMENRHVEITRPLMPYDPIHRIWRTVAALHPARLLRSPEEPSFGLALREFARAASIGEQTKPDIQDGLRSLAAVMAAEESAARGGVKVAVKVLEDSGGVP